MLVQSKLFYIIAEELDFYLLQSHSLGLRKKALKVIAVLHPLIPRVKKTAKATKKIVDFLIIQVHAGLENFKFPIPEVRDLYKEFIDLGAD